MGRILVINGLLIKIFNCNFFLLCKDVALEKKLKLKALAENLKGKHFVIATVQVGETFTLILNFPFHQILH